MSTFRRFLQYMWPYKHAVAAAIFFGLMKFTLALSLATSLKYVSDYVFLLNQTSAERVEILLGEDEVARRLKTDPFEAMTPSARADVLLDEEQIAQFAVRSQVAELPRSEQLERIGAIPEAQGLIRAARLNALGHKDSVSKTMRAEQFQRLLLVTGLLTLCFIGRSPMTYLRSYLTEKVGQRIIFDIRKELFRHVQRLGLTYHSRERTGATISRLINDLNAAQGIMNNGIIAMAMDMIFLVGVVAFLLWYDWRLGIVSIGMLPFYGLIYRSVNPRLRAVSVQVQEEMEEMSGEATEKLAGVQVVMSFVREKTEEMNFFVRHRRYYSKVIERVRLKVGLETVADFLTSFGPILVIVYGGYRAIQGSLTFGDLLLFNGYLGHLYLPTRRLADYSAQLEERLAAMDRVFELLDQKPDINDSPRAYPLRAVHGTIRFENVHFSYNTDKPVLNGVTFDVEPGQSVAFVGRSGAGKSTLASLVPRFYDVTAGAVLIDGHDVRNVTVKSLREQIGIVHQDPILFSGTIRENILYGRLSATDEEVMRAAKMAHVHEFVQSLPRGYESIIGERGLTLSGGQKQRLSIARAFLRDPRILILDEATSNLDSGAEQIIQDALRELMLGRTTLVIAHRLSTIVDCDKVVVLSQGQIVQEGPHSILIHEKGPYRQFCKEQFGDMEFGLIRQQAS